MTRLSQADVAMSQAEREKEMTLDSKVASDQLNRILTFFPRVDNRASLLFAANSAILGVLAAHLKIDQIGQWIVMLPFLMTLVSIVYSFFNIYLCTFPNTKGGNGSNVYFASIAQKTESAFVDGFRKLDESEWMRDLSAQIWRNSEILVLKYRYLQKAMIGTMVAVVPWAFFIAAAKVS